MLRPNHSSSSFIQLMCPQLTSHLVVCTCCIGPHGLRLMCCSDCSCVCHYSPPRSVNQAKRRANEERLTYISDAQGLVFHNTCIKAGTTYLILRILQLVYYAGSIMLLQANVISLYFQVVYPDKSVEVREQTATFISLITSTPLNSFHANKYLNSSSIFDQLSIVHPCQVSCVKCAYRTSRFFYPQPTVATDTSRGAATQYCACILQERRPQLYRAGTVHSNDLTKIVNILCNTQENTLWDNFPSRLCPKQCR